MSALVAIAPLAAIPKTLPILPPIVVLRPNDYDQLKGLIESRVSSASGFLEGLSASSYQGDPRTILPAALLPAHNVGNGILQKFAESRITFLQGKLSAKSITASTFPGESAYDCHCYSTDHAPGCQCPCPTCLAYRERRCQTKEGEPCAELCPCRCPEHHSVARAPT